MAEYFDILDKNGTPTGATAPKGTALNDGEYYLGVHAYLYNARNEFLLQQRAWDKAFLPGGWDIHMGHVVAGESSKKAMAREIQEEIGLLFPSGDIRFAGRLCWEQYHHMIDVYFLQVDFDINALKLQEEEVIGAKTVSAPDMLNLVAHMDYRPVAYRRMVTREIEKLIADV